MVLGVDPPKQKKRAAAENAYRKNIIIDRASSSRGFHSRTGPCHESMREGLGQGGIRFVGWKKNHLLSLGAYESVSPSSAYRGPPSSPSEI